MEVILVWLRGRHNPADFMSKVHTDVDVAINSAFWRHGSPLYLDKNFPNVEGAVIYGKLSGETYTHYGFANSSQHLSQCFHCSSVFDVGPMVVHELVKHGQQ